MGRRRLGVFGVFGRLGRRRAGVESVTIIIYPTGGLHWARTSLCIRTFRGRVVGRQGAGEITVKLTLALDIGIRDIIFSMSLGERFETKQFILRRTVLKTPPSTLIDQTTVIELGIILVDKIYFGV